MRWNRKFAAYVLMVNLSCVGLLMALSNSAWTQEAKKANAHLKELQQQRLAVLEQARETATALFRNARASYEESLETERDYLAARLEYAATRAERIKACDQAIDGANNFVAIVQQQNANARNTHLAVLKSQAYLLETKIRRAKLDDGD